MSGIVDKEWIKTSFSLNASLFLLTDGRLKMTIERIRLYAVVTSSLTVRLLNCSGYLFVDCERLDCM